MNLFQHIVDVDTVRFLSLSLSFLLSGASNFTPFLAGAFLSLLCNFRCLLSTFGAAGAASDIFS